MLNNSSSMSADYFGFEYEANDSEYYNGEWFTKFFISFVIYMLTFIIGTIGNTLVIFSIFYLKKLQSITNLFLLSLATADLTLVVICVPIKVKKKYFLTLGLICRFKYSISFIDYRIFH